MDERNIGKIVSVDSLSVFIKLDENLKSLYKSGYEEIYPVARINSYIIIPVGADRIVALVNRVMTREETDLSKGRNETIFLTESNRYLSATMVGTIENGKRYLQGVYNYPILDNPVWYATREDLDKIFDQKNNKVIDYKNDFYLPIGTSPAFPDYQIKINPDKLFAKHAAILGNTGSGKSCTLAAILQSLFNYKYNNEQKLKNAHIIIFDTNGEYKEAFNLKEENKVNPFCISKEGLKVPYWFMNYEDMDYIFEPTVATQSPILKRALGLAKSKKCIAETKFIMKTDLCLLQAYILDIQKDDRNLKQALFERSDFMLKTFLKYKDEGNLNFDLSRLCEGLNFLKEGKGSLYSNKSFINGQANYDKISIGLAIIEEEIQKYYDSVKESQAQDNRNIDIPNYFNFSDLLSKYIDLAIKEQGGSIDKMMDFLSTLRMRMQSYKDDIRLASPLMLDTEKNFITSLEKFLAYILGDYCRFYTNSECNVYNDYYGKKEKAEKVFHNQITIIDMSLLPYQVLETITGLIGRIVLEFLSHFKESDRGKMPVVLVLEEAQNYIPEVNKKDRISISKKVFERIAREGRKYGLSLLISSQRPSELSKTVLSQCNSFIIHRIQNPDDQSYIRKLVSNANAELLSQLPTLPQQHVLVMGDCVRTPVVAKMNTAIPSPNSNNPEFIENWLNSDDDFPDYHNIANKWLENKDCNS